MSTLTRETVSALCETAAITKPDTLSHQAYETALSLFDERDALQERVAELRKALLSTGTALGGILSDEVSDEFLGFVADEARLKMGRLEAAEARCDALRKALEEIAYSTHCIYEIHPFFSEQSSSYNMGVADGHRRAAKTARAALRPSPTAVGEE